MLKISRQQALDRWETLPQNLKDAIFDENNADIIWKFGRVNHLSDDKIKQIAGVAGDVIMGFMHPDVDEIAKEIEESAEIPKEIALEAAEKIEKKILLKIKSDLNKVYAPAREGKSEPAKMDNIKTPKSIETETTAKNVEMKKAEFKEVEPPANLPFAPLKTNNAQVKETAKPETKIKVNKIIEKPEPQTETKPPPVEKPFLLHEEKPLFTPSQPAEKPSVSFRPKQEKRKTESRKPVAARVSLPGKEPEGKRVVHYSDFSSKLDK